MAGWLYGLTAAEVGAVAGGLGEPLARFRLTLTAAWRMIGTSGFDCLGLMRGEAHDATYGAIVKRQIAEVSVSGW